jgi:hypothetical protein
MFEFAVSYVEIAILTGVWVSAIANVIFYSKKWKRGEKE